MSQVTSTKSIFTVSQFLNWQQSGVLELSPNFQRRGVWKPSAKSYLIDSVARGFPLPVVLLRQIQDVRTLSLKMEVVDGQQRLRTLLAYIDPNSLTDFDAQRDSFKVSKNHNLALAGKSFSQLDAGTKHSLLSYEISTHVFPASTADVEIYKIFARLNSTGLSLKPQEIRNSEFHGEFKSFVYGLAFEMLDYWRGWGVYTNDALSRMDEVEAVSEFVMTMLDGIKAKSQSNITAYYKKFDAEDSFKNAAVVKRRFESVMSAIESRAGDQIPTSSFKRPALFFSLFVSVYDHMYGLSSKTTAKKPISLPHGFQKNLIAVSDKIKNKTLKSNVQDAMDKATTDKARRDVRHKFLMTALQLVSAA